MTKKNETIMKNIIDMDDMSLRLTRDTNEKHRLYNPGQNSIKVYSLFGLTHVPEYSMQVCLYL